MRGALLLFGSCTLFVTMGCGGDMTVAAPGEVPGLGAISQDQWAALGARRYFFGHQSVGVNIIAGLEEVLSDREDIPLRLIETDDPAQMSTPGLYHARIGENERPGTKLTAFRSIVSRSPFRDSGAAMLKFCYLDMTPDADPVALFEQYRETVESIRDAHPDLTMVHFTMPLTTDPGWLRHVAAIVRGRRSARERNHMRERYNDLIRSTFGGEEPIFDVARYEAIGSDGRMHVVRSEGQHVPVLADEWTSDGGHLNESGRRRMAEAFLATLATIQ